MVEREGFREMHRRIDGLEKRLAAKAAEIGKAGKVPAHFQEEIDAMYAKAKTLRAQARAARRHRMGGGEGRGGGRLGHPLPQLRALGPPRRRGV